MALYYETAEVYGRIYWPGRSRFDVNRKSVRLMTNDFGRIEVIACTLVQKYFQRPPCVRCFLNVDRTVLSNENSRN